MLNSIVLVGRLVIKPELQETDNSSYTRFSLAFDNPRLDGNGERGTSFIQVTCFGSVAESICEYLDKGDKIGLKGTIQEKSWMNKEGAKRSTFEVVADSVEFLNPKKDEEEEEIKPTNKSKNRYKK